MGNVLALLSVAAPLALIYAFWVLAQISRRFGEVTHRKPFYRAFYACIVLMLMPVALRLLAPGMGDNGKVAGDTTKALAYTLPLALSLTIAIITTWIYWGWLIYTTEDARGSTGKPTSFKR